MENIFTISPHLDWRLNPYQPDSAGEGLLRATTNGSRESVSFLATPLHMFIDTKIMKHTYEGEKIAVPVLGLQWCNTYTQLYCICICSCMLRLFLVSFFKLGHSTSRCNKAGWSRSQAESASSFLSFLPSPSPSPALLPSRRLLRLRVLALDEGSGSMPKSLWICRKASSRRACCQQRRKRKGI